METKFIVDNNVGKMAKWLRMMGYDAVFFLGEDDGKMVNIARREGRVVLTRDSQIMKRRLVASGELKVVLLQGDDPREQLHQAMGALHLDYQFKPFSLCLECNEPLMPRDKEEVRHLVPPYVFQTQTHYMQCPSCKRVYWRGTHWEAMSKMLEGFVEER